MIKMQFKIRIVHIRNSKLRKKKNFKFKTNRKFKENKVIYK